VRATLLLLATFLLVLGTAPGSARAAPQEDTTLENGLRVTLRSLEGGRQVALVVVFDVGDDHDPEGCSGLCHLVEHCYVTCAAGATPARTAEAMVKRYPQAWNAQTGERYTVIAFMFPPERLEAEVAEAAARMGALKITQADLDRELPRMREELATMYGRMPRIAARNLATERVRPPAEGARRGGVVEQLEALGPERVQAWYAKHYKPGNARLALVGPVDGGKAKALIEKHFGGLPAGEAPPAPRPSGARGPDETTVVRLEPGWTLPGTACRAWRAPGPHSPHYPAFLAFVMRAWRGMDWRSPKPGPQLLFQPLDAPDVVTLVWNLDAGTAADEAAQRLEAWVEERLDRPFEAQEAKDLAEAWAGYLATADVPEAGLAMNPYLAAFGALRRAALGIDSAALARELAALDQETFDAMREAVFGEGQGATVVVLPAEK